MEHACLSELDSQFSRFFAINVSAFAICQLTRRSVRVRFFGGKDQSRMAPIYSLCNHGFGRKVPIQWPSSATKHTRFFLIRCRRIVTLEPKIPRFLSKDPSLQASLDA